jgi:hypothetical protein
MPLDFQRARPLLQKGDLARLFIEELGWEPCRNKLTLRARETDFNLTAIAEKRGFTAWEHVSADGTLPDHTTRLKLDRALTQTSFEHLIVFSTRDHAQQSWMWVRREPGKPLSARTHEFNRAQPGDSLLQKLQILYISLEEEEAGLSVTEIAGRARAAFDIERVTKAFYRDFDTHRKAFLKFIDGIGEVADREWYASVMLNRLMFVYFIQRKGFLDGDHDYLRNRLDRCKKEQGKDKFYTFYRYFLLRLFHEGFGKRRKDRSPDLEKLLGNIPYLNGGLFDVHELEKPERYGKEIQIEDKAFERVFNYFDHYQWHLDERPLRADNEINPDVLGYIFEKYINQKQMGAYYTKEDITEYISKSTVLPFLFDAARAKCKVAFENLDGPTVWDLLKENPNRYIYAAVRHGEGNKLPADIAAGVDVTKPNLIERRKGWNKPAPGDFALPTETWREVVARRERCEDIRKKLVAGEVREINDFVTLNLDLRQFAQDVLQSCEGPDLLMAFWQAITSITVLDPTGGSGAFIFAALNILEPLYEACLDRMEAFLTEWGDAVKKLHPNYFKKFTEVLARVDAHPNRRYFVLKSIILNNLYAVDIMEEAVEICKLRLFLKLAAQVEPNTSADNLGIEPLPDIDFNIRAGNTLVGYATKQEVQRCMKEVGGGQMKLMDEGDLGSFTRFNTRCADVEDAFAKFRHLQTEGDGSVPYADKQELQKRLKTLEEELNRHLAGEYGIKTSSSSGSGTKSEGDAYARWLKSHQPFHWFIQFYGIITRGGFDVIIGNPPYVEYNKVENTYRIRNYKTLECGNLYVFVLERSKALIGLQGRLGFIVPIALVSVAETMVARELLLAHFNASWFSSFAIRPAKLFDGVEQRLTIWLAKADKSDMQKIHTTKYLQWYKDERPALFEKLEYAAASDIAVAACIPKLGSNVAHEVVKKLLNIRGGVVAEGLATRSRVKLFFHRTPGYWIRIMDFEPHFRSPTATRSVHHIRELVLKDESIAKFIGAVVSSSLYFFWFFAMGNCRNLTLEDVKQFRIGRPTSDVLRRVGTLFDELMADFQKNSFTNTRGDTEFQEFNWGLSKPIIDEIDAVLSEHFGLTDDESDFVRSYDIKIRMGKDATEEVAE